MPLRRVLATTSTRASYLLLASKTSYSGVVAISFGSLLDYWAKKTLAQPHTPVRDSLDINALIEKNRV